MRKWLLLVLCVVLLFTVPAYCCAEEMLADEAGIGSAARLAMEIHDNSLNVQKVVLYYPDAYNGELIITVNKLESGIVIAASTVISEREIGLYALAISEEEIMDGVVVGTLESEAGKHEKITLGMYEISSEEWTEEEFAEICELQETVNDILLQLQKDSRSAL